MVFFAAVCILDGFQQFMVGPWGKDIMLCMTYMSSQVAKQDTKTCLDTYGLGKAPSVYMKAREMHHPSWLLFGIVWKRNGPMFSFSNGWSEDQNHGKDKVGSVVSLDETMQLPWQEKILT